MVTIKDISEKLGIAPSTVSKGLHDAKDVSPEVKKLVLDTAIEMGYVTKKMKNKDRKKLALFVENMLYEKKEDFGYDIILGFRQAAAKEEWDVVIIPLDKQMQENVPYDRYMMRHEFHGGFFIGVALDDSWILQMEKTTIPTVLLDNFIGKNTNVAYVGTDSFEGIDFAIEHLKEHGHTRIALINGSEHSMISEKRHDAFIRALQHYELPIDEDLIAYGHFVEESAKYHFERFYKLGATAIVCGNDLIAVGVLKECKRLGVKVPQEVSVVGFDNVPIAAEVSPALTTINQDRLHIGKSAYATLYWLIEKVAISVSLLRPSLVIRESTGKVNKK